MGENREIQKGVWEGRIPVAFRLSEEDTEGERPEPVYLMVPRISYFPLHTEKINKHFLKYASEKESEEIWLEHDNQPLKWHYPVGLLFDLYGSETSLPWTITVHFKDFPEEELLHCVSKDAVESHFMSSIKEADSLKHRGQVINSMQKRDHKQLWTGLLHDKFDQFWSVNKKLMESSGDETFKYIPFRLYMVDRHYMTNLFRPLTEEGHHQSLKHLLLSAVPQFFNEEEEFQKHVRIHGAEPLLDTPILWLSENFSFPDNFLHLVISDK